MPEPTLTTILVVDDENDMRMLVRVVIDLANHGLTIVGEAKDGVEGLEAWRALAEHEPDVVVLDNRMPRANGLEVASRMLEERPDQAIVLFSAFLDDEVRADAAAAGIARCLTKEQVDLLPQVIWELTAA